MFQNVGTFNAGVIGGKATALLDRLQQAYQDWFMQETEK